MSAAMPECERVISEATRWQFRWEWQEQWEDAWGATERDAADHLSRQVGSSCPVPGAYRPGKPAKQIDEHYWMMPTGAVVEMREVAS